MQLKPVFLKLGTATRVGLLCALLAVSALADERFFSGTCTNATLSGDYGFTVNGTILYTPSTPANAATIVEYIQGVQMIHADGNGNLGDYEAININGVPLVNNPPSYFSEHYGTYTLNSNCTGTAFLTNGVNFVNLSFVVDQQGAQVRMLVVPPYDSGGVPRVVTSVGSRLEQ